MKLSKLLEELNLQLFAEEEVEDTNENDNEDELNEDDFEETEDEEQEEEEPSGKDKTSTTNSKSEENSRQAQARREREKREKQKREEELTRQAYVKGQLDAIKTNPFTNKPIVDENDLKIYELQLQIKEAGGDPVEDLPDYLAKQYRKEQETRKKQQEEEQERQAKIDNDLQEFREKYPKTNITKLLSDPLFKQFSEGQLNTKSLVEVYETYKTFKKSIIEEHKKSEQEKVEKQQIKKETQTPGSSTKVETTTTKNYLDMTKEERIAYLRQQRMI